MAGLERRGQDLNLRSPYELTGLANPRIRPLCHLSNSAAIEKNGGACMGGAGTDASNITRKS